MTSGNQTGTVRNADIGLGFLFRKGKLEAYCGSNVSLKWSSRVHQTEDGKRGSRWRQKFWS